MTLTGWAAGYAEELLAPLGDRWAHVQGVVRQAEQVAAILPAEEREVLIAAAYLHDLGYAPALTETGFHALDGARHLRALGRERLAGLVAYHSGARGEAELRGLTVELAEFTDEASATSMALTYCDMTTGPAGEVITYEERLAGVEERYGAEHVVARSVRQAGGPLRLPAFRGRAWRPAVIAAGLDGLRIHDLRHTAVALWIAAGANPKEVSARAGIPR
jgi:hypothetical protein